MLLCCCAISPGKAAAWKLMLVGKETYKLTEKKRYDNEFKWQLKNFRSKQES